MAGDLITTFEEQGVLKESGDGAVVISDDFHDALVDGLDADPDGTALQECPESISSHSDLLKIYSAISARLSELPLEDRIRGTLLLDNIVRGFPRTEGAPEGFLPVHGNRIPVYLGLHQAAIVYVWDDDCPPCESVRDELEGLEQSTTEHVALLAVFGPESAEFLYDEYSVKGAPTTLFFVDGDVDVRLIGSHTTDRIAKQVDMIRP